MRATISRLPNGTHHGYVWWRNDMFIEYDRGSIVSVQTVQSTYIVRHNIVYAREAGMNGMQESICVFAGQTWLTIDRMSDGRDLLVRVSNCRSANCIYVGAEPEGAFTPTITPVGFDWIESCLARADNIIRVIYEDSKSGSQAIHLPHASLRLMSGYPGVISRE